MKYVGHEGFDSAACRRLFALAREDGLASHRRRRRFASRDPQIIHRPVRLYIDWARLDDRVGLNVGAAVYGQRHVRKRVLPRQFAELGLDFLRFVQLGMRYDHGQRPCGRVSQGFPILCIIVSHCTKALIAIVNSLDEAANRVCDREFAPPYAEQGEGEFIMPHDLDRDDDVGDEELKTVPGKATRLSHACQKQVVCLYPAGPLKLLQVDQEELAQARSDNSHVDRPRQP